MLPDYIIMSLVDVMIRTQVQLEEDQYKQLRAIGAREDKGLAEQVREAVALYLTRKKTKNLPSLESVLGKFTQAPIDDLKPHDRWYVESIR